MAHGSDNRTDARANPSPAHTLPLLVGHLPPQGKSAGYRWRARAGKDLSTEDWRIDKSNFHPRSSIAARILLQLLGFLAVRWPTEPARGPPYQFWFEWTDSGANLQITAMPSPPHSFPRELSPVSSQFCRRRQGCLDNTQSQGFGSLPHPSSPCCLRATRASRVAH